MSESTVSPADLVSAAMSGDTSSEPAPPVSTESAPVADNSGTTGGHPAWQEILGTIPEVLHEKVRPTLQRWDQGVQEKLAEYTRTYEPYKPYVDAGTNVEEISAGLQLVQLLNSDPRKFYEAMAEHYGYKSGQGDTSSAEPTVDLAEFSDGDLSQHPQFKQLAEQQQQMLQAWQNQQVVEQQKQADAWLSSRQEQISGTLKEKSIDPDWDYILNKAMSIAQKSGNYDAALDTATAEYVKKIEANRAPVATLGAPPVVAPGSAIPSSATNLKTLPADDRKKLLAQALSQALKE